MADHSSPDPPQGSETASGAIDQSPQQQPLSQESVDHFADWKLIGGQEGFYTEQDCLQAGHNLAVKDLEDRGENEVVIFDYSLDPGYLRSVDRNTPVGGGGPSSGRFSADDDIFSRVSKDALIESRQFHQIINPSEEPEGVLSEGPRLGIIDFPQCYDTHDDTLLNMMGEKLGLQRKGGTAFMRHYLGRVRALPGHGRFRTGISLRAPFKEPPPLPKEPSEYRFVLFISFPYFGESSGNSELPQGSESIKLLDFEGRGVDVPDQNTRTSHEEEDIRKILVHQARYMIFDNFTMATFRSKEDSARGRVPLHRFQARVGAFRAVIHMIANLTELELSTLGELRAFLRKIEKDMDKMISDATTYEDNQGMVGISTDELIQEPSEQGVNLTREEEAKEKEKRELARQNNVRKRKQGRVRDLLTSLNKLSAGLFAAISVAERQIVVLKDLHTVFSTSCGKRTGDSKKGDHPPKNPFHKNIAPIPILSENPEQIWPATLDTIDEVVQERKSFIKEIKGLVKKMDIRRKILSTFLKSDQAKAAPSEISAQEATRAMQSTEAAIRETQAELVQQGQTLTSFTIVTTAFLPLGFCSSYYGMSTITQFSSDSGGPRLSLRDFWLATGPVLAGILLLTAIVVFWKSPGAAMFKEKCRQFRRKRRISGMWSQWRQLSFKGGIMKRSRSPPRNTDPESQTSPTPQAPSSPALELLPVNTAGTMGLDGATLSLPSVGGSGAHIHSQEEEVAGE